VLLRLGLDEVGAECPPGAHGFNVVLLDQTGPAGNIRERHRGKPPPDRRNLFHYSLGLTLRSRRRDDNTQWCSAARLHEASSVGPPFSPSCGGDLESGGRARRNRDHPNGGRVSVLNGDAVSIIDTWPNMVGIGISVVDTFNSAGHVNIRLPQ